LSHHIDFLVFTRLAMVINTIETLKLPKLSHHVIKQVNIDQLIFVYQLAAVNSVILVVCIVFTGSNGDMSHRMIDRVLTNQIL